MDACHDVGWEFEKGEVELKDEAGRLDCAKRFYQRACDGGLVQACHRLVPYSAPETKAQLYKRMEELLTKRCERHDSRGCIYLGSLFEDGEGVPKDAVRAASFYRRSCEGETPQRCLELASGLPPFPEKVIREHAATLFTSACDGGDLDACVSLGTMHQEGRGVPKDLAQAARLYKKACDGDTMAGCTQLGRIAEDKQLKGRFGRPAALFKKACEGGDAEGCLEHANLPSTKDADLFNDVSRACSLGSDEACRRLSHDPDLPIPP
jgi:TPR repeat protein